MTCPKCNAASGDDWSQCRGGCPMAMSPHFDARVKAQFDEIGMEERPFCPLPPED